MLTTNQAVADDRAGESWTDDDDSGGGD